MASNGQTTCWTVIRGAAEGDERDRRTFADSYRGVARAYLLARWQRTPIVQDVDDAVQEVFIESFREGGVLSRANPEYPGGFRAFFYGVVRNVALRFESRHRRRRDCQPATAFLSETLETREATLSRVFDRAWATAIMQEAARMQRERADTDGGTEPQRRVELLRLRFQEGLPIREIARLWGEDASRVHREYARARREFRSALSDVVASHHPGSVEATGRRCEELLGLLK